MANTDKIVLGTVQFGVNYGINNSTGQVPHEEVCKILSIAKKGGIKTLDTSSGYGASEAVLGKSLKETGTSFNIVSKYPRCDKDVRTTFEMTIANLDVDSLYGYLVHHFDFYQERPKLFDDMIALKNEGKIQKVGFSLYTVDQLQFLLDHDVKFDILQFPYNIFDRQFEPYMHILVDRGVEIHTRSAFLQGLFFKDTNTLPLILIHLKPYLDSLHQYCEDNNLTVEELAFGYVLANDNVSGALIGVDNHHQLESNIRVAETTLSIKDIEYIKSVEVKEKDLLNPVNWN